MSLQLNGTAGVTYNDGSNQPAAASPYGLKNRIINGNMVIDQRNAGASVTPSSSQTYTLDRWRADMSVGSKFSVQQVADAPSNFVSSLKVTSTSAYTVGAADYFSISHQLEGYNTADIGFGTSGAKDITLSFWTKSSLTGTHGGVFGNQGDSQLYPFSYTISSANTWEKKTINIPARTVGTWATNNTASMRLQWYMGLGSNYYGTVNAWNTGAIYGVSGQINVVATSGATWFITGVQLEIGTTATPFENRMYGTELALCQRYYEKNYDINTAPATNTSKGLEQVAGTIDGNQNFYYNVRFAVPKRANPSITFYKSDGTANTWRYDRSGASNQSGTPAVGDNGDSSFYMRIPSTGATWVVATMNGFWTASAEL